MKFNIPFNNFEREYLNSKKVIDSAISDVLKSAWFILGNQTKSFEQEFADYIGVKYCIGLSSGTDAIALALISQNIGIGDEVITTNMTAFPTITGIMQSGASPVVVDIYQETGLINVSEIKKNITKKTKAILPVHLYGQSCDMDKINKIAHKHNLIVIEDCAQSVGSLYNGNKTGTFGICSAFSFYPTKNLGAYGDAGAIVTNDKDCYEKVMQLRNYGQSVRYIHDSPGYNCRIDELQAAILRVKLKDLDNKNKKRREIASIYKKELRADFCLIENNYSLSNYHLFVIKSKDRDKLSKKLLQNGVSNLIHYPIPINKQKAFPGSSNNQYPNTETFASEILSIPIFPELTEDEIKYIIEIINKN